MRGSTRLVDPVNKDNGSISKGKPRGIRHDRDCFTCRKREIKCDLNRPGCNQCAKQGFRCEGYPARVIWCQVVSKPKKSTKQHYQNCGVYCDGANTPGDCVRQMQFVHESADINWNSCRSENAIDFNPAGATVTTNGEYDNSSAVINTNVNVNMNHTGSTSCPHPAVKQEGDKYAYNKDLDNHSNGHLSPAIFTPGLYAGEMQHHHHEVVDVNAVETKHQPGGPQIPSQAYYQQHTYATGAAPAEISNNGARTTTHPEIAKPLPSSLQLKENVDDIDPLQVSHFVWGIKAIAIAMEHASQRVDDCSASSKLHTECKANTQVCNTSPGDRTGTLALTTTWKFVASYFNQDSSGLDLWTIALDELQHIIKDGAIEAIFSILAFTYVDVCQGSFGQWHRHLKGARGLLDIHCARESELELKVKQTPGLQHALTLLTWYDVMGALASQDRPFIFEDWHRNIIDDRFFRLVGCPKHIFHEIVEVFDTKSGSSQDTLMSSITLLLSDECFNTVTGDANSPSSPTSSSPSPTTSSCSSSSALVSYSSTCQVLAAQIWHYALVLISVERAMQPSVQRSRLVQILVTRICDGMSQLPMSSSLSQHLAVIVFVTSKHAKDVEHREIIKAYWQFWTMSQPFPLYQDALYKCEQMWLNEV